MVVIKLKQSDIEKIAFNVIKENSNLNEQPISDDITKPGPGKEELKLAYTEDGTPVLYKTNSNGQDELVKKF
jgi:hypothetical protein